MAKTENNLNIFTQLEIQIIKDKEMSLQQLRKNAILQDVS